MTETALPRPTIEEVWGWLGDVPDPLAGLRGTVVPRQERT